MSLDAFLQAAWSDHGDKPQEVADRLTRSLHLVQSPEEIPPFVRILTHVFGEHLGQWQNGEQLLEQVRRLPAFDGGPAASGAVARGIACLRYAGGDSTVLAALSQEDCISVLATTATALIGHGTVTAGISALSEALRLVESGLPSGSHAIRALAVAGNNVAAALEEKKDRAPLETRAMVSAAEAGLKYWSLAGTWLEIERAEYRLTRSLLQAGDAAAAVRSAGRCVAVCRENDAPPLELFFGHAVLAISERAAGNTGAFESSRKLALEFFERVPGAERDWCKGELSELRD